ncbi:MAG: ABC transporter ATP-binding protein [Sedimentisphaerales bacterium]|nr:ABC transporter ATP-binding protein [Sedimentisphaerales bacterium]
MSDLLIKTEKLCKTFHHDGIKTPVLFDVDMQVRQGEFVAVMGPSGCGKSTLMHILGLMLSPSGGDIIIDGCSAADLNEAGRAKLRREKIGFVFQRFNLLPTVSGYDNIAVAERIRGNTVDGQVDNALAAVDMTEKARFKPGRLSIGQQQRIAIARAIVHRPRIVMADEPTGNLDSTNAETILELFRQIHREQGITIFLITHSLTAAQYADRIIYMADGRIQDIG